MGDINPTFFRDLRTASHYCDLCQKEIAVEGETHSVSAAAVDGICKTAGYKCLFHGCRFALPGLGGDRSVSAYITRCFGGALQQQLFIGHRHRPAHVRRILNRVRLFLPFLPKSLSHRFCAVHATDNEPRCAVTHTIEDPAPCETPHRPGHLTCAAHAALETEWRNFGRLGSYLQQQQAANAVPLADVSGVPGVVALNISRDHDYTFDYDSIPNSPVSYQVVPASTTW